MNPIYTLDSCKPAYQLRWSLAIFPTSTIPSFRQRHDELNTALANDGIRILDASASTKGSVLLLLSTQPHVRPLTIVQRVKGRLQYLLRSQSTVSWRRNFRLSTIGDANIATVEEYVATQLQHHKMASDKSQQSHADFVWEDKLVNIAEPIFSSHGQYVLGMHLVLVHAERWCMSKPSFLERTQRRILGTAKKYDCQVSRLSILADHLHVTMRFHYGISSGELAIACMNNVAYGHDMLRIWMESYYTGTIGPYDMNAVRS